MFTLVTAAYVMTAVGAIQLPPAKYDHEPTAHYTLTYETQDEVNTMCALDRLAAFAKYGPVNAVGCTNLKTNVIKIVKGLPPDAKDAATRHEKAHINGWRH